MLWQQRYVKPTARIPQIRCILRERVELDSRVSAQVKAAEVSIKTLTSSADEITSEADRNYVLQQLKSAKSVIDGLSPGGDL
jgi:hypothetical protein